jgi:DNA damage-inducible protein 1
MQTNGSVKLFLDGEPLPRSGTVRVNQSKIAENSVILSIIDPNQNQNQNQAQAQAQAQQQHRENQEHRDAPFVLESFGIDVNLQRSIEENIRNENIAKNMEIALEHTPEAFVSVNLLYIPCSINGHEIIAMIDTGAQATILTARAMRLCNLERILDTRFKGRALGVGAADILGRVHSATVCIANDLHLMCSFSVLDNANESGATISSSEAVSPLVNRLKQSTGFDMLLGLDMLLRHAVVLDLKRRVICIHGREFQFSAAPREHDTLNS